MSEALKKVARAICASVDGRNPDQLIAVYEGRPVTGGGILLPIHKRDWENYLVQARAAIKAMREPTDAMAFAGAKSLAMELQAPSATLMAIGYVAMIDEALKS